MCFFLQPGELLENGVQSVKVLCDNEGFILKALDTFTDENVNKNNFKIYSKTLKNWK